MDTIQISPAVTPNPHTIKFAVNRQFFKSGACNFPDREKAAESALASKLFGNPAVAGVLIGPDFISITKTPDSDWQKIMQPLQQMLYDFLAGGEAVLDADRVPSEILPEAQCGGGQTEAKIIELVEKKIRPVLLEDGGDVEFRGYENGVVRLHLQGACRSCPSAAKTLKSGIETYLKRLIPEIREVVSVE